MTLNQYKIHGAIVSELRRQFLEFWSNEAIPGMKDSGVEMTQEEQIESMNQCWRQWRRGGLEEGSISWFINPAPNEQN